MKLIEKHIIVSYEFENDVDQEENEQKLIDDGYELLSMTFSKGNKKIVSYFKYI